MANALAINSGWVLLTWVPRDGRLINQSVSDTSQGVAGGIPILALDMYEHAYQIDFGTNAAAYVATFMRNIEWNAVQGRYEDAIAVKPPRQLVQKEFGDLPSVTIDEVKAMLRSGEPVQVIDTRPRHYTTRAQDIVEGAVWRDPERVDDWIGELSKERPVVTFCVYGFHIGCEAATLRKAGFDARYMAGGHYGWKAAQGRREASRDPDGRRPPGSTPGDGAARSAGPPFPLAACQEPPLAAEHKNHVGSPLIEACARYTIGSVF